MEMRARLTFVILVAVLLVPANMAAAQPVKLALKMDQRNLHIGDAGQMTVEVLDAQNRPVAASKPMHIVLSARQSSGKVIDMGSVDLGRGQSTARVSRNMSASGLLYVWAKNPELLSGGQFVDVRAKALLPKVTLPHLIAPPPVSSEALVPQITLQYSPQRAFLADGKDAATVEAFLIGDVQSYPQDIRLNVFDSANALTPTPLTIPAGQPFGQASLTSGSPGTVSVQFLGSSPAATFEGDKDLKISFVAPITRLGLQASPPAMTLVDTAEVVVTLLDESGRALAPGTPKTVSFALMSGRGYLSDQQITIPADQFQARTTFAPESWGNVVIQAQTGSLASVTTELHVGVPVALLLCSIAGGAIGGLLTQRTRRRMDRYRVPIGIATGFLFYWACIFLGLARIGREFVLNPLSALALSAIGGWLQTKVFNLIWGAAGVRGNRVRG